MTFRCELIRVLQVDPGLFTPDYDSALSAALIGAGVSVNWAVRGLRPGELLDDLPVASDAIFYKGLEHSVKGAGLVLKARKGASHLLSLVRLVRSAKRGDVDIIHFQWLPFPLLDSCAIYWLRRRRPVVVTVHDLEPYNGAPTSRIQLLGFESALAVASRLIVHTDAAKASLVANGRPETTVSVIPHGPLSGTSEPRLEPEPTADGRWRVTLFGKLQAYKGVDILVEALGRIPKEEQARLRVTIAGEALIPLEPLRQRIRALHLESFVHLTTERLDEGQMHDLFSHTDAFVFPYRAIQASGVLFLTLPWRRWMITSDLGVFIDYIQEGVNGFRVPADNPSALAIAIAKSIGARPSPEYSPSVPSWGEIAGRTADLYRAALASRS